MFGQTQPRITVTVIGEHPISAVQLATVILRMHMLSHIGRMDGGDRCAADMFLPLIAANVQQMLFPLFSEPNVLLLCRYLINQIINYKRASPSEVYRL